MSISISSSNVRSWSCNVFEPLPGYVARDTLLMGVGAFATGWVPFAPAIAIGATSGAIKSVFNATLPQSWRESLVGRASTELGSPGLAALGLGAAGLLTAVAFKTALLTYLMGVITCVGVTVGVAVGVVGVIGTVAIVYGYLTSSGSTYSTYA